jgi:hypothetical protein
MLVTHRIRVLERTYPSHRLHTTRQWMLRDVTGGVGTIPFSTQLWCVLLVRGEQWTNIHGPVRPTRWQLSLSACVDLQRAWEGPRGSLSAVLCRFLGQRIFLQYGPLYVVNRNADILPQKTTLTHRTAR